MAVFVKIHLEFEPELSKYINFHPETLERNSARLHIRASNQNNESHAELFLRSFKEWSEPADGLVVLNKYIDFVEQLSSGSKWDIDNKADLIDELKGLRVLLETARDRGVKFRLFNEYIRKDDLADKLFKLTLFLIALGIYFLFKK